MPVSNLPNFTPDATAWLLVAERCRLSQLNLKLYRGQIDAGNGQVLASLSPAHYVSHPIPRVAITIRSRNDHASETSPLTIKQEF